MTSNDENDEDREWEILHRVVEKMIIYQEMTLSMEISRKSHPFLVNRAKYTLADLKTLAESFKIKAAAEKLIAELEAENKQTSQKLL